MRIPNAPINKGSIASGRGSQELIPGLEGKTLPFPCIRVFSINQATFSCIIQMLQVLS
jgi:hypothetical protein